MEAADRGRSGLGLELSLILFYAGALEACTVSVTQPSYLEVDHTFESVTIQCTFSTTGCPPKTPADLWFRYGTHKPEMLCSDRCTSSKFSVSKNLDKKQVNLTVHRVTTNDSAIYICGMAFPSEMAPGAKRTGNGTTLVVRGQSVRLNFITVFRPDFYNLSIVYTQTAIGSVAPEPVKGIIWTQGTMGFTVKISDPTPSIHRHKVSEENKLLSQELLSILIVLVTLFSVYVAGVFVLLLVLSKSKSNYLRSKETKEDSQKRSARRIFQEIAQELNRKRYVETSQQPEKDNTYENRRAPAHYERP